MLFIMNGTLITMTGDIIHNGNILIAGGKIRAIGRDIDIPIGFGGEIIDAHECIVMPGIIEAHCHMGIIEEKKGTEGDDCNEGVDPITPQLRALDAINFMDAAFHDAIKAGITSAMIGPGSANVVGGQFAFVKTHGRCIDTAVRLAPAAMKIAFGENPKNNYGNLSRSPMTRMAIAAMLREELFKARNYCHKRKAGMSESERDFRLEPWIPIFEKRIPLKAHCHRVDDILTAIRIAKEFDLDMTLDHCSEGHLIADEIKASGFPAIVGPDFTSRSKIEVKNVEFKTAGVLERAGVKVAITTDHPVSVIQSLPLCAGLAVKAGMSMHSGMRALTLHAAEICRMDQYVGSLEVGKDADIAIFNGNPMEIFTRTLFTIIDGEVVYRAE